jgi:hypothetical protein
MVTLDWDCAGFGALSNYIMLLFYIRTFSAPITYRKTPKKFESVALRGRNYFTHYIFVPVLLWNGSTRLDFIPLQLG